MVCLSHTNHDHTAQKKSQSGQDDRQGEERHDEQDGNDEPDYGETARRALSAG